MHKRLKHLLTALLILSGHTYSSDVYVPEIYGDPDPMKTRELNWLNQQFLDKQRGRIEEITRNNFGRPLRIGSENIALLQRIIDENLIKPNDTLNLQALGVVLGDIYVRYNRKLVWRVYVDDVGKTHAVCIVDTDNCLFPITMLSRRMEVGLKPNVERVFNKGLDSIKPLLF